MALPVKMLRWDDEGAPQIVDGKPSEYFNVIKKCLVDGYGNQPGLGWTVADEIASPQFLAIKNDLSVGSGGVITLSANDNEAGSYFKVQGCQHYVDKDNRIKESPYVSFNSYSSALNLLNRWFLIGNGKAFYLFIFNDYVLSNNVQTTRPSITFFAGDFDSLYPNDPSTFTFFSGVKNSSSLSWSYTLPYLFGEGTATKILYIYPLDGSLTSGDASLISVFGNRFQINKNLSSESKVSAFFPVYIAMGDGLLSTSASYHSDEAQPLIRGVLPGAYVSDTAGNKNDPMPVIKTFDGIDYYLIPSANSNTACVWINLKDW